MKSICSYDDFVSIINDETVKKTNLVDTNIHMEDWTPGRFVEYLGGLESHKHETGDKIYYESYPDQNGRISIINIQIYIHPVVGSNEQTYFMKWSVKYKDN